MITIICGKKGSGKTKRIIDTANNAVASRKGDIVFVDDDKRYMYDLNHQIRFIDMSEFCVSGGEGFAGFISGMVANNYDIDLVLLDGFLKIVKQPMAELKNFFEKLDDLSKRFNINFVISVSADISEIPDFMKVYIEG